MVISMHFNSIDMYKYILGDLKLVWGLRVHKCRGRSHKVGPAAKVGPCPFAVVHNGTSNFSLLVLSNVSESTNERYQNTSKAISKT